MKRLIASVTTAVIMAAYGAGAAHASSTSDNGISPTTNAGFVMTPSGVRSVSAEWTVPTVSCNTPDAAVRFAVELAEGGGTANVTIGVDVDCQAGVPAYAAWFHMDGAGRFRLFRVHVGDDLEMSLEMERGRAMGSMTDYTRGRGFVVQSDYKLEPTQAAVVASRRFGATGLRPLADFGIFEVASSEVNGRAITRPVTRLQMRPPGDGGPQVRVSNLQRPEGSFTATWLY